MAQKEEWNNRYSNPEFAYGLEPNNFLKFHLSKYKPGNLLLPGDGEGRNTLWAAKNGWDVTAFDFSETAVEKSNDLLKKNSVEANVFCQSIEDFTSVNKFDAIGLTFLHLPSNIRIQSHKNLINLLKANGIIILECFHPDQLERFSGGPKNPDLFPQIEEIKKTFSSLTILSLTREEIQLNEGQLHQGEAIVIRMIAQKN